MSLYCYAKLTDEQLAKVRAFETETGKKVLILKETRIEPEYLGKEEYEKLLALEKELRYVAVVVR